MTVRENLANGVYENKLLYPSAASKPRLVQFGTDAKAAREYADALAAYEATGYDLKAARIAYQNEDYRLRDVLRLDLETEHGINAMNPKAAKLFELAWQEGHSEGLGGVINWYEKLVDLVI